MKIGRRVTAVVEGQRAKIGHGVNAEAATDDSLRVIEGAIGKGYSWLEVSLVAFAQTLRQAILTGGDVVGAWAAMIQTAAVERLLEGQIGRGEVLLL